MTRFYQPLGLTVNGSAKRFIVKKFNGWYSDQISEGLQPGTPLEDTDVKLRFSILKYLHVGWVVDFCNLIISAEGKEVILNGWEATGMYDTIRFGTGNCQPWILIMISIL